MDLRTLTKLMLKLFGLYGLFASITQLVSLFALPTIEWFMTVNFVAWFALAAACFWFPGVIVNRVLRIEGSELEGAVTADRLFGVGVSLLGLYLVVSALFPILFTLAEARWFYHFTKVFDGARGPDMNASQFASLLTYSLQLIGGLFLWFGWRPIVRVTGMQNDR